MSKEEILTYLDELHIFMQDIIKNMEINNNTYIIHFYDNVFTIYNYHLNDLCRQLQILEYIKIRLPIDLNIQFDRSIIKFTINYDMYYITTGYLCNHITSIAICCFENNTSWKIIINNWLKLKYPDIYKPLGHNVKSAKN